MEFWERHPDAKSPLMAWYKLVSKSDFTCFEDIRRVLPSADDVKGMALFNIGGNKYRLIAAIHFNTGKLALRHVLTHKEYDRDNWKK